MPAEAGKPLFLYFHGNGGGLSDRVQRFTAMTADGRGLLAVSFRSYFGSTGKPTESGLNLDAEAAYAEAIKLGYAPEHMSSWGSRLALASPSRSPRKNPPPP